MLVACFLGWTAISRQARATCYQLRSVEQTEQRERQLATTSPPRERAAHLKSAESLSRYASGLRAIVPSCEPLPPLPSSSPR